MSLWKVTEGYNKPGVPPDNLPKDSSQIGGGKTTDAFKSTQNAR